ncbi:hypothetical protein FDK21_02955 [Cohaesibacter sp. CAU 1516]|uniref:hypothetical protein n=1 Tax=Cohaesibacter sp. CAU 1516 TaxID=2576038 RepID=UPI0010FD397E|nr:hypothetical protein [Cohaesibacter sp. CAU 1516]TLP48636.1 hypothetical protein FDK21_02955 [Cohaesibacter sp. CAU 1516]
MSDLDSASNKEPKSGAIIEELGLANINFKHAKPSEGASLTEEGVSYGFTLQVDHVEKEENDVYHFFYSFSVVQAYEEEGKELPQPLLTITANYHLCLRTNESSSQDFLELPKRIGATIVWTQFRCLIDTISAQMNNRFPRLPVTPDEIEVADQVIKYFTEAN